MSNATDALVTRIEAQAKRADAMRAEGARLLRQAVRQGRRAGLSQRAVARAVGRSQPEVARLERFSGTTKRAKALMTHRTELRQLAGAAGFTNLRVFGSVARGQDTDASDIDILFDYEDTPSLMRIARVERRAAQLLGTPVDLVPAADLRPGPASTALEEAIPL